MPKLLDSQAIAQRQRVQREQILRMKKEKFYEQINQFCDKFERSVYGRIIR